MDSYEKACDLFSDLSAALYYGKCFRGTLARDPEALAAAEKLVERLKLEDVLKKKMEEESLANQPLPF
jgi:hypothetical protein